MNTHLQYKLSNYFDETTLIKNDSIGLVVSYAKTHFPEVKKTLVSMLQTTLLAQGAIGLLNLNKNKILRNLSKVGVIYANLVVIKEQHKDGIKQYRQELLSDCADKFYANLGQHEKDEILIQSRALAGIYHDRDSKDGLKKFRAIIELWGDVFHSPEENKVKFLELVDYLLEYHSAREQGFYEF